jgi:hypothetical protein
MADEADKPKPDEPAKPVKHIDRFRILTSKLLQVPKTEVDEKEAEYQMEQKKKPKRGPKKA